MFLLGFRRKLTAQSIESGIQWFQIHHIITFATIQNSAVYLSGARVSIFSTLVPRLKRFFFITAQFFCSKMQKSTFWVNKRFECSFFIELKCRWLHTRLAGMKNTKRLGIVSDIDAKINFLKKISILSAVFIEVQVITHPSSRHEKHQTLDFLLMTDFLWLFKTSHFPHLSNIFENHQPHVLKSLYVFYLIWPC